MQPSPDVFDLFAVPESPAPVGGGRFRAGDLVLASGRDAVVADWLNPILARLAADLDHQRPRSLRIAMPIPTRDLRWVADGWSASRFEPDARPCHDLDVLSATGRLLHAHLATVVTEAPDVLARRNDSWARAERAAFGAEPPPAGLGADLAAELASSVRPGVDLGPNQLVHADLARNVLLDSTGLPVVIDVQPHWRPALWAEAVCVLDAVVWLGEDPAALEEWSGGVRRQAMLRAALFRLLGDPRPDVARYRAALAGGTPRVG